MGELLTLIRPPVVRPKWNYVNLSTPPIGLAYIAGSLRSAGFEVCCIDSIGSAIEHFTPTPHGTLLQGLPFEEIIAKIPPSCTLIGLSIQFSFEFPECKTLLHLLRQAFPHAFLFAGGEHATALPEFTLKETPLNAILLGEGEHKTLALAQAFLQNAFPLHEIPGMIWKSTEGTLIHNAPASRILEIDKIPKPAWDLFPLEEYLSRHLGFGVSRGRNMPVLASRGCPYQCTFCSSPLMWTTTWKAREPEELLNELEEWIQRYRIDNFDFYDLTAIIQKDWIVQFCQKIQERQLRFTWQLPSGTRTEAIDDEVAKLLYQSGCRNLSYAPESGSLRILKLIKKKIHPQKMLRSLRSCVRHKLNVKTNIILGFPGETHRDIWDSYLFIIKMAFVGAQDLAVWCFSPYPGSELFQQLVQEGKIPALDDQYFRNLASYADPSQTVSYSTAISTRQLLAYRTFAVLLFYGVNFSLRPWRVFILVKNLLRGRYESRSEQALASIISKFKVSSKKTPSTPLSL
jgi:anaerobic magnesium-protoporphyrin IX monomethyl ester cyclase